MNKYCNFIDGVDVSPEENIKEGYVSAWYHPKEKKVLYIFSKLNEGKEDDEGAELYTYVKKYITEAEVNQEIKEMSDLKWFLEYVGMPEDLEGYLQSSTCCKLMDKYYYDGGFFGGEERIGTQTEVLCGVLPDDWQGEKNYEELSKEEQERLKNRA